jgi:hypothetical protein
MSGDKNAVQMETTRWATREFYVITNLSRTGQNFLNLKLSKPDGGDLALLRWACAVTSVIENGPQQPPSLTPRY